MYVVKKTLKGNNLAEPYIQEICFKDFKKKDIKKRVQM